MTIGALVLLLKQYEEKMQFSKFTRFAPKLTVFDFFYFSLKKSELFKIKQEPFKLNSIVNDIFTLHC